MPKRRGIVSHQRRMAPLTLVRLEDDHLIDRFHGHQGARKARMARLTAPTALTPLATGTESLRRIT